MLRSNEGSNGKWLFELKKSRLVQSNSYGEKVAPVKSDAFNSVGVLSRVFSTKGNAQKDDRFAILPFFAF